MLSTNNALTQRIYFYALRIKTTPYNVLEWLAVHQVSPCVVRLALCLRLCVWCFGIHFAAEAEEALHNMTAH